MAKKIWLGSVLVLIILTTSFYLLMPEKIRIDFTKTRTIYTIYNEITEKFDDRQGIEYTRIFDGTTLMRAKSRNITFEIKDDTTNWYRLANFKEGIVAEDYLTFDNQATDVENVPVSHRICFSNAKGRIFEYLISNIEYKGLTKTIESPFAFGKNMKVIFQDGYYRAKVYNYKYATDKIKIRYRITEDYQCFDVRLFDPIIHGINVTKICDYEILHINNTISIHKTFTYDYNCPTDYYKIDQTNKYGWCYDQIFEPSNSTYYNVTIFEHSYDRIVPPKTIEWDTKNKTGEYIEIINKTKCNLQAVQIENYKINFTKHNLGYKKDGKNVCIWKCGDGDCKTKLTYNYVKSRIRKNEIGGWSGRCFDATKVDWHKVKLNLDSKNYGYGNVIEKIN